MINRNFQKLAETYLFSTIAQKVRAHNEMWQERRGRFAHGDTERLISLGIGDVTQPLAPACIDAMHRAVDEMARTATFRGYGPEQGYDFLRQAIIDNDYLPRGVRLDADEVFISDGAKSDCGNIGDILDVRCSVGMTDPVYPVYLDSNVMGGRAGELQDGAWSNVTFFPVSGANAFVPALPDRHIDIIYLCYPNNPTGTVINKAQLKDWVDYALRERSIIMFDAAYEAYIRHDDIPHSIYEIEGAEEVAIELRSFSKTAGFTGMRCGYTVVPKALVRDGVMLNRLWNRRQCTKFNGTSYVTQRGAEAVYSVEGKRQIRTTIDYYMTNAAIMRRSLLDKGYKVFGGEDAPYIWLKTPEDHTSWSFFDYLLTEKNLVTTPGVGFGPSGEGYVRLTAFGRRGDVEQAMSRL